MASRFKPPRGKADESLIAHKLQTNGISAEGASQAMHGDEIESENDRLRFRNMAGSIERTVYPDPQRPNYNNGKPVVDHIRARALDGHPTDPRNLRVIPHEMNSRKGGHEGALKRTRERYIKMGLTPQQVDLVLADELAALGRDAIPRPMDPKVLARIVG